MAYSYDFGGGGGGYDYQSLLKGVLGGGMGGTQKTGGGGLLGRTSDRYDYGTQQAGIVARHSNNVGFSTGGSMPTIDPQGAAELRASIQQAPYAAAERLAGINNTADMQRLQMQARIQMAQTLMGQQDEEKNRQLQLELQRRNALQAQYAQNNASYKSHGI